MSLGGCRTGALVNPKLPREFVTPPVVVGTVAGLTVGDEKYGVLSKLIASIRNCIFIPSRILKFFEMPTSNFRKR